MKKILVNIVSNSIGDTISCIPYIEKFRITNGEEIYVGMNDSYSFMFINSYPSLNFIGRNSEIIFDKIINLEYDFNLSIQGGYAKQLGFIDAEYIRPVIDFPSMDRPIKNKYISIGIHSTSQLKYWNSPKGKRSQPDSPNWNDLCGLIRKEGITPVVVEQHEMFGWSPYRNGMPTKANKKFGQSLKESINYINHSEFYIGLSSGMSWVAHALGKPVVMISNFTEDWNEFDLMLPDYKRITNKKVCHGCWNLINKEFSFDVSDWYWCPRHKDTDRQFECHTSITSDQVFNEIKDWIETIKK